MSNTAEVIQFERPVVKADIDNGYDRLAHDITDAFSKNPANLSGCEFQVIFAIIGKTYRWQKKADWIANSQLCEKTGMSKSHISKVLKSLIAKNVVIKNGRTIGLNNVVSEWEDIKKPSKVAQSVNSKKLSNQETPVVQSVDAVVQSVNSSCPVTPPQKKETITKEIITKESNVSAKPSKLKNSKAKSEKEIPHIELPDYVNRELFESYLAVRIERKHTMSSQALNILTNKLSKLHFDNEDVNACIENAILGGWQSVWGQGGKSNSNVGRQTFQQQREQQNDDVFNIFISGGLK